jgi:hypothetical protein
MMLALVHVLEPTRACILCTLKILLPHPVDCNLGAWLLRSLQSTFTAPLFYSTNSKHCLLEPQTGQPLGHGNLPHFSNITRHLNAQFLFLIEHFNRKKQKRTNKHNKHKQFLKMLFLKWLPDFRFPSCRSSYFLQVPLLTFRSSRVASVPFLVHCGHPPCLLLLAQFILLSCVIVIVLSMALLCRATLMMPVVRLLLLLQRPLLIILWVMAADSPLAARTYFALCSVILLFTQSHLSYWRYLHFSAPSYQHPCNFLVNMATRRSTNSNTANSSARNRNRQTTQRSDDSSASRPQPRRGPPSNPPGPKIHLNNDEIAQLSEQWATVWGPGAGSVFEPPRPPLAASSTTVIALDIPRHHVLRHMESLQEPPILSFLVYNMQVSNSNYLLARALAGDLKANGYNIARDNFTQSEGNSASAYSALASLQAATTQTFGDLGSTPTTFSRVLNVDAPQNVGAGLGLSSGNTIPAYLYINRQLLQGRKPTWANAAQPSTPAPPNISSYEVVPVYTPRTAGMNCSTIANATANDRNWVHILNFVMLSAAVRPALAAVCRLIRLKLLHHMPNVDPTLLFGLIIIKTSHAHLIGTDSAHLNAMKRYGDGPMLTIHMDRDPNNPDNQQIYELTMQCLIQSSRASSASANLMGIQGVFTAPLATRSPMAVDVQYIPRSLPKHSYSWLLLSGVPRWCTSVHLQCILQAGFAMHAIHLIFPYLDAYNAAQSDMAARLTPSLVICVYTHADARSLLRSQDSLCDAIRSLDREYAARTAGHDSSWSILALTAMPHCTVHPPTATTPRLRYKPMSTTTLDEYVDAPDGPRDPQAPPPKAKRSRSTTHSDQSDEDSDEVDPDVPSTDNTPGLLPTAQYRHTLDSIQHQLSTDPTDDSIRLVLDTLNKSLRPHHLPRLQDWITGCASGEFATACIQSWIARHHGPSFQLVDSSEWTLTARTDPPTPPGSPNHRV